MSVRDYLIVIGLALAFVMEIRATPVRSDPPVARTIKPQRTPHRDNQAIAYMEATDEQTGQITLPPNRCIISFDRNLTVTGRVTIHLGVCPKDHL